MHGQAARAAPEGDSLHEGGSPGPAQVARQAGARRRAQGRAVQVDPIKPTLKAPGTKRLKLKYDEPLSKIAFEFNLRRCSKDRGFVGVEVMISALPSGDHCSTWGGTC